MTDKKKSGCGTVLFIIFVLYVIGSMMSNTDMIEKDKADEEFIAKYYADCIQKGARDFGVGTALYEQNAALCDGDVLRMKLVHDARFH